MCMYRCMLQSVAVCVHALLLLISNTGERNNRSNHLSQQRQKLRHSCKTSSQMTMQSYTDHSKTQRDRDRQTEIETEKDRERKRKMVCN